MKEFLFIYSANMQDAQELFRLHSVDPRVEFELAMHSPPGGRRIYWITLSRKELLAGLEAPIILHWHCEPIPLDYKALMMGLYRAFVLPVHCTREGCRHDQSQGSASG